MDTFLSILTWIWYWYASGLVLLFLGLCFVSIKGEEVQLTLEDIVEALGVAAFGPLLLVVAVAYVWDKMNLTSLWERSKKKVVWRNRKAKNRHILFGSNKED